jgi:ABC-2 type transport system ATP-binding protein
VDWSRFGEVVSADEGRVTLRVPKSETARVTERLLASVPIADLTVEDPPIEEVIEQVFAGSAEPPAAPVSAEVVEREAVPV